MYPHTDVAEAFRITTLYTAFKETYNPNYVFTGEYHNFWEIVVVLNGELGITAGSDAFTLKKGRAVLHEPMEFHRLRSVGGSSPTVVIFSFAAENMPKYQSKIFEVLDLKEPPHILEDMHEAFDFSDLIYLSGVKENSETRYQLALKSLESFILRLISRQMNTKKFKKSRTAEHYSKIITVMEDNIDKNLSVSDIAELCNMSEINLKKTFSLYAGMGVTAYFNTLKVSTAISMLKNGMTVSETAAALGFANQNYFSTVFRRINGHSPSYYK